LIGELHRKGGMMKKYFGMMFVIICMLIISCGAEQVQTRDQGLKHSNLRQQQLRDIYLNQFNDEAPKDISGWNGMQ
jgi:hypothetical protein